jgi:hypothetical protein
MIHRLCLTTLLLLMGGVVGCGGAKIKDYNEALPIPDIPLAGGGGEEPEESAIASPPEVATDGAKKPQSQQQPERPTKAAEFE